MTVSISCSVCIVELLSLCGELISSVKKLHLRIPVKSVPFMLNVFEAYEARKEEEESTRSFYVKRQHLEELLGTAQPNNFSHQRVFLF